MQKKGLCRSPHASARSPGQRMAVSLTRVVNLCTCGCVTAVACVCRGCVRSDNDSAEARGGLLLVVLAAARVAGMAVHEVAHNSFLWIPNSP